MPVLLLTVLILFLPAGRRKRYRLEILLFRKTINLLEQYILFTILLRHLVGAAINPMDCIDQPAIPRWVVLQYCSTCDTWMDCIAPRLLIILHAGSTLLHYISFEIWVVKYIDDQYKYSKDNTEII